MLRGVCVVGNLGYRGEESRQSDQRMETGELSAARQALEGASLAPRTLALRALSDPERRPPVPREGLLAMARVPHVILEAIKLGRFDSPQQARRRG